MDRIKRKRKRMGGEKKVLLSIVDPWDVKLASVNPVGLAERRGVSLSILPSEQDEDISLVWSTLSKSVIKTPSPWYKPGSGSSHVNPAKSEESALIDPIWLNSRYSPRRSPINATDDSPSSIPSRETLRDSKQKTDDDKASEVDNGLINGSQEISRNGFDDVNGTAAVRVRFEIDRAAEPWRNGVRCVANGQGIDDASRVLTKNWNANDNYLKPEQRTIAEKQKDSRRTDDTKTDKKNANSYRDDSGLIEKKSTTVDIVQHLVVSRYNPQTAKERRLKRMPSCRRQEASKETDSVDKSNDDANAFVNEVKRENNQEVVDETNTVKGLPEVTVLRATNIRKTSISMPINLDKMDDLRIDRQNGTGVSKFARAESETSSSVTFSNSGSTPNGSPLGSDTEEEANDEELAKVPLQAPPRRKSRVMQSPMNEKMGNDATELSGGQSANSTITSVNSISSLLKEKLQLSLPQALRNSARRQNADYRLRAFVGFLFLCVVFLVGFAHIYYNQHVLQRAYFDKFRFNKNERMMTVYSSSGGEIIAARLGEGIPPDTGVYPCLPHHQRQDSVCLEWLQQTRLYLAHTKHEDMHCYHVTWQSLSPYYNPKDCFDWSSKRGHWYGAGQIQNMAYPLERGRLELSPFITGDVRKHSFGNVLKRYFLNSKGATILVDAETPLYVSINANRTNDFCLQAKHDAFAYINHLTPLPQLNYTICATDNMKTLHSLMAEKSLWDGLKPDELHAVHSLLSEPVWQISPINEAAIYNYTEDVIALGFLRQGHVLLSEEWQPSPGDFVLDEERFPSMEETINIIHRRGFRIVFSIQPFISTESVNFKDAVANRLLISERGSDPRIPALTRYKQSNSAGVLDITNNKTLPWLQTKLESLIMKYHVDSFYLDLGTAQDMPHYYKCQEPLTNPDHYKTIFTRSILSTIPVIGVSSAISRPRAPVFVSLPPFPSSWKAIKTVIPTVLSYGMIGYPFIMPGAVGGDVALPMSDNNPDNDFEVDLPDKELYIRWLQLSTFLPVIRFTHLPSKYSDESVLEIAKRLTTLRQKTVTPLLKKYANETLDTGLPIIRPLWMLDPADPACHVVVDEFSVGEELIVAPVLYSGSRQREVYLPAGVWRDGIDGSLRKGSRWIHNYRVAEDKIAYFVKMPDNTRF
ncbi:Myogenesis-regulating glycosidase [Formica fusca]